MGGNIPWSLVLIESAPEPATRQQRPRRKVVARHVQAARIRKVNWELSRNAPNAAASSSMGCARALKVFGLRVLARWFVACLVSSGEGG
jgi:hypothetical protein